MSNTLKYVIYFIISQYFSRKWLGAWWHQAITWTNVDHDNWYIIVSLGIKGLTGDLDTCESSHISATAAILDPNIDFPASETGNCYPKISLSVPMEKIRSVRLFCSPNKSVSTWNMHIIFIAPITKLGDDTLEIWIHCDHQSVSDPQSCLFLSSGWLSMQIFQAFFIWNHLGEKTIIDLYHTILLFENLQSASFCSVNFIP